MKKLALLAAAGVLAWAGVAEAGATLTAIKSRGSIQCGVNTGLAGFGIADSQGNWVGHDIDFCRALAAAVLNDRTKVKFTPLSAAQRFTALQSGEVDVLSRNTTLTLVRDASLGLHFAGVWYYDGQGFMVPKKLNVKSAKELNGAEVCVQTGTTTELNLADYFRANRMQFKPVVFESLANRRPRSSTAAARSIRPTRPAWLRSAPPTRPSPRTSSFCPRSSRKSRSGRPCAGATTSGSRSSSGC